MNQFDLVQILTTRNIRYLSGSGPKPTPNGTWSVIGFIQKEALIAKDNFIAKVPIKDLIIIGSYDINKIFGGTDG